MCHFVLAILPDDADIDTLKEIAQCHSRWLTPIDNPSLARQLNAQESAFTTTPARIHCDCGTPIGDPNHDQWAREDSQEREARTNKKLGTLRKRGWSDAKIKRWLEQREHGEEKRERAASNKALSDHPDSTPTLQDWYDFVIESFKSGRISSLGLLKHSFSGPLSSDPIRVRRRKVVQLARLNESHLANLAEDTILHITSR